MMLFRRLGASACAAVLAAACLAMPVAAEETGPVPRSPGMPYAARNLPDRIVLTPGADPSRSMGLAYRTDMAQAETAAEIVRAVDSPTLERGAAAVSGTSEMMEGSNGAARYHHVRFEGLQPGTVYAYRVKGSAGWSEWYQFRTAAAEALPFRFVYFGDVQNGILPYGARVIRQAFRTAGEASLVVHAGDLVALRDDLDHDDEWGEWAQAGGYNYASVPQLVAAGNHEYDERELPNGEEEKFLGAYWGRQFTLPSNGAAGVEKTSYFVDYQGVRFVVLDGTAALELGQAQSQATWLDATLASSRARWNVVVMHQPVFTCARPENTEIIGEAWKPIFEKHRVDLVLQGHDHCYSRVSNELGSMAGRDVRVQNAPQGPVYIVSVVGSKMYGLNDRAGTQPDKVAADTQLFQVIDVAEGELTYRSYTATGRLYDAFDLERLPDGTNRLRDPGLAVIGTRLCDGETGPDGGACVGRKK